MAINLLDFVEIANDRVHNVFQIYNQDGERLSDHLTIHFLEIPKITQATLHEQPRLIRWLAFLKAKTAAERKSLVKGDPIMEKAFNALEFLSQDEQTRQRYEARQKALHDYATAIETAKQEGRQQEKEDMVRRMLIAGLPVEKIAEIAGWSAADITALKQQMQQRTKEIRSWRKPSMRWSF